MRAKTFMPAERFIDTNILLYGYDLDADEKLYTEDLNHGQDYDGVVATNPFR